MAVQVTCRRMLVVCTASLLICLHAVSAANETNTTSTTPVPVVPTTTPAPPPAFPDNTGSWNVTEGNVTCIMIRAGIRLNVNYTTDTSNNTRISPIDIPSSAVATGKCNDTNEQFIKLSWYYSESHALENTLTIVFKANATSRNESGTPPIPLGKYAIIKVSAVLNKDEKLFPNATNVGTPFRIDQENLVMFPTSLNHSYACASEAVIGSSTQELSLNMQNSQIEAFGRGTGGAEKNDDFSAAEHCAADEISSGSMIGTVIITILIIVLLALGAAALVTYVLKKRRATGSGYENM